jgi:hypothetical protein
MYPFPFSGKKNFRFGTILGLALILALLWRPDAAQAENWFKRLGGSLIQSSSDVFESQKQGHFAGGGMSLRLPVDKTPFFHFTPPRINAGCGGIDAFWGGFSFLNPEYLIQKLKNILMAAPAYAFQLALETLCEPCANIITTLSAIADQLNGLASDDCRSAKMLVNGASALADSWGIKSAIGDITGGGGEFLTGISESVSSWLKTTSDGLSSFRKDLDKMLEYKYCNGSTMFSDKKKCLEYFTPEGSFWERAILISQEKNNNYEFDKNMLPLVRAIFGDYVFMLPGKSTNNTESDEVSGGVKTNTEGAVAGKIEPVESCVGSLDQNINAMTEISEDRIYFWLRVNGNCTELNLDSAKSYLGDFATMGIKSLNAIDNVIDAIVNNSEITSETISVINQSSLPMYTMLNTLALQKSTLGYTITESDRYRMARLLAVSHALFNLNTLCNAMREYAAHAKVFFSGISEDAPYNLNNVFAALDEQISNVDRVMLQLRQKMNGLEAEYFQHLDTHLKQLQLKVQLQAMLSKTFSAQ